MLSVSKIYHNNAFRFGIFSPIDNAYKEKCKSTDIGWSLIHKEGSLKGEIPCIPYSATRLQDMLTKALVEANIPKPVTLHWLRHSYGPYLPEAGTDLRYIQELLGHKSSKTTEIYTHVSTKSLQKIRSPFDDL
jgi:integrase